MEIRSVNQGSSENFDFKVKGIDDVEALTNNNKGEVIKEQDDHKELEKAVEKLNKSLEDDNAHVEYEFHDKFKDIIIKVVDNDTKEVILEVPPRKILDMVAKLCELSGVVVDKKA